MILAILQARFTSTRLPGKVLKPILGKPMLLHHIERLRRTPSIHQLVLATSADQSDDPIATMAETNAIICYRGSLEDVLDRFYQGAKSFNPTHVVRLTGDCPLADAGLIEAMIQQHLHGNYDYTSNVLECTYPDGLDAEIFRFSCLEDAWREAKLPSQREHVTPFINRNPDRYRIFHYKQESDLSHLRWTVDEPLDFELVSSVYEQLYPRNPHFTMHDILELLARRPDLQTLNLQFKRNEGLEKSLEQDKLLLAHS